MVVLNELSSSFGRCPWGNCLPSWGTIAQFFGDLQISRNPMLPEENRPKGDEPMLEWKISLKLPPTESKSGAELELLHDDPWALLSLSKSCSRESCSKVGPNVQPRQFLLANEVLWGCIEVVDDSPEHHSLQHLWHGEGSRSRSANSAHPIPRPKCCIQFCMVAIDREYKSRVEGPIWLKSYRITVGKVFCCENSRQIQEDKPMEHTSSPSQRS